MKTKTIWESMGNYGNNCGKHLENRGKPWLTLEKSGNHLEKPWRTTELTMGKTWSAEELWGEGPGLAMSAVVITNAAGCQEESG